MKWIKHLLVALLFVMLSCESGINYNPMKYTVCQVLCDQGEVVYCEFAEECSREDER